MRTIECGHPDQPYFALNKCKVCYYRDYNAAKWTPEFTRTFNLKRAHNLTVEEYDNKFKAQDGVCAICGRPPKKTRLHVDHKHTTGNCLMKEQRPAGHAKKYDGGQHRGLLCYHCNIGIGYLENPDWLTKAQVYLAKYA
jgi:hypothetical protein